MNFSFELGFACLCGPKGTNMGVETKRDKFMQSVRQSFMDHGYKQQTMTGLALRCDLTPRALYNHFASKEDAFRESVRWHEERHISAGLAAGARVMERGGSTLDAIVVIVLACFGESRHTLLASPHASELTHETLRRCHDVVVETATLFQDQLASFLSEAEDSGLLSLRSEIGANGLAQMIADAARGVTHTLIPLSDAELAARYRRICATLLRGAATGSEGLVSSISRPIHLVR